MNQYIEYASQETQPVLSVPVQHKKHDIYYIGLAFLIIGVLTLLLPLVTGLPVQLIKWALHIIGYTVSCMGTVMMCAALQEREAKRA
jgi:uncharacterized membrane protein HdeD (DUF308 family)